MFPNLVEDPVTAPPPCNTHHAGTTALALENGIGLGPEALHVLTPQLVFVSIELQALLVSTDQDINILHAVFLMQSHEN